MTNKLFFFALVDLAEESLKKTRLSSIKANLHKTCNNNISIGQMSIRFDNQMKSRTEEWIVVILSIPNAAIKNGRKFQNFPCL